MSSYFPRNCINVEKNIKRKNVLDLLSTASLADCVFLMTTWLRSVVGPTVAARWTDMRRTKLPGLPNALPTLRISERRGECSSKTFAVPSATAFACTSIRRLMFCLHTSASRAEQATAMTSNIRAECWKTTFHAYGAVWHCRPLPLSASTTVAFASAIPAIVLYLPLSSSAVASRSVDSKSTQIAYKPLILS